MKIALYLLLSIMLFLTLIGFNESLSRFLFASGSDVLMELIRPNLFYSIIFLITYAFFLFTYNKWKNRIFYFFILITFFLFWMFSGRTIALFPDGRLISGWFYFETNRIDICKNSIDCEKTYYYETVYLKEFPFTYKIKNKSIDINIYTGPFISEEVSILFCKSFPARSITMILPPLFEE